jgi:hypothetical protein
VVEFGEQRIYASHHSIMFARKSCYFFVRPRRAYLEVVFFLGRAIKAPRIKKVVEASKVKRAHIIQIKHRDEVEAPITDWLREAYDYEPIKKIAVAAKPARPKAKAARKKAKAKRKKVN